MHITEKIWQVQHLPPDIDSQLSRFPPVLRPILYRRGFENYDDAIRFLRAEPPEGTSAWNLYGMEAAVDRICHAIQRGEQIVVYGDYDADGVTATALLTRALRSLGASVRHYIPNRFDEGYGLNNEALDQLAEEGVSLVITVDCGIRSVEEVDHARRLGLDLIISDHHQPGSNLPEALAVINPKQPACTYIEKNLAGVGLAYKIAAALIERLRPRLNGSSALASEYLDLVAIGTVADLAPLTGENRALVRKGLEHLKQPQHQGLLSLMHTAGIKPDRISSEHIGFGLGPRLNAAGRLESALAALDLLLTDDVFEAGRLAQQLEVQNRQRQQLTRQIQEQAEAQALSVEPDALLLFAADPGFNPGVVGLAASRLTEKYYRPSIVAHQGDAYTRGSCRSIPEFHITAALDACADILERHGGHAAAAGFTVRNEHLAELVARLKTIASEQLGSLDLRPTLKADIELRLSELQPNFIKYLQYLQPTGYGNPQAVFVSRGVTVKSHRTVGHDGSHLKLLVSDGWVSYDAIAFRQGHWAANMPRRLDIMYTFETNEWQGNTTLQLNVRDLKPAS